MKKILLVDDDAYKISIIKKVLDSTKGYDVIIENALNPGLKRLMTDRFDLILLDMSMPTFSLKENANFNSFGGIDFLVPANGTHDVDLPNPYAHTRFDRGTQRHSKRTHDLLARSYIGSYRYDERACPMACLGRQCQEFY